MADEGTKKVEETTQQSNSKKTLDPVAKRLKDKQFTKATPEDLVKEHKFWDSQPVPKLVDNPNEMGPIEPVKTVAEERQEPLSLPGAYEWFEADVTDDVQMKEIYQLLYDNYVEDDDNMFRFDYSVDFLRWALQPPGWRKEWHVCVRAVQTKKLYGFITAIPAIMSVHGKQIKTVEINFLCVHKKLRSKRLAPVLISEITRRVHLTDCWQAIYTAGRLLPRPVTICRYWHRNLNPKKLVEIKFTGLGPRQTMQRMIKLYELPNKPQLKGIRPMEKKDVAQVAKLLNEYLARFKIYPVLDEHEVEHWLVPRKGIIFSYVVENGGKITDFCSFYNLPSTVIGKPFGHETLNAAFSYYNVATSVKMVDLVNDALIFAKLENFDVFNCLDLMENGSVLSDLKFGRGDGNLYYYLYNWKCPAVEPNELALVLL